DACDFARYCSGLDFFALTDHSERYTPERWLETKAPARERNAAAGEKRLRALLRSGEALEKFKQMVKAQGGNPRVADDPDRFLPQAKRSSVFKAKRAGYITRFDALLAGRAGVALGAGRDRMEDKLDYGAGILLRRKVGDRVKKGEEIARLYSSSNRLLRGGAAMLERAVAIGPRRPRKRAVIRKIWR
ncbi:MAG: hypothetical protein GY844_00550, partial [Bradyrhizobium sp.]|nr:hypothetical protein [Bradyrhizobium sp.]